MDQNIPNPYVPHIVDRLREMEGAAREQFRHQDDLVKVRYFYIDDLLPSEMCQEIYEAFPEDISVMREMKSLKEHKRTSKNFEAFPRLLHDISVAFQDQQVIDLVEEITGLEEQVGDPHFYAGGLSMMGEGHFLNPHLDNSHDSDRKMYRTLNLLFYVTPDWNPDTGGNLELWDSEVKHNKTISSEFNRLVVMETNPLSWHSVSPITENKRRCCVSNYYFSERSPTGEEHFHVTSFSGRPEQAIRRQALKAENALRMGVRKLFRKGVGKKDLYNANDQ